MTQILHYRLLLEMGIRHRVLNCVIGELLMKAHSIETLVNSD